ncbi:MAG: hypothetical protein R6U44_10095 [Archaeoglobaceae archaeon]
MERRELKLVLIALLIGGIIVSIPFVLLGWAGYQHYQAKYIHVSEIEGPNYLDLTSKVDECPPLKEAVNEAGAEVQLDVGEYFRVRNLVGSWDYLKINGTVYKVHLTWAAEGSKAKVEEVDNYTTVSREELENCSLVEDLIMSIIENEPDTKVYGERYPKYRATKYYKSAEDLRKAKDLVKESNVIKFEGEYYEVFVETNLSLSRYQTPSCMSVTKEQLEEYPTLQKALKKASESGEATLKTPPEEWREINVRDCVSYNGSQYRVGFSLA